MKSKMDEAPKRGRGRGRGGRGRRGRGRGRGRGKKATMKVIESEEEVETPAPETVEEVPQEIEADENVSQPPQIDLEADISQLEAPTFTTINRGPPEPMLRLNWNHKVNLIGEKVLNPLIHCCDKCLKPILIYGRMLPCKHVFCLACGKKEHKQCPRCLEKVARVEQAGLGTVFMCIHGGTRHGQSGCRRTYLSQRDLQAHINHRHVSTMTQPAPVEVIEPDRNLPVRTKTANDPRSGGVVQQNIRRPAQIQTTGVRTNLITVPIQESAPTVHETIPTTQNYYSQYPQTATYSQPLPPMHIPPPQQPQYYAAPPQYSPAQSYPAYTAAAPAAVQYAVPAQVQTRTTPQYDYSAAPPAWTQNQYYR